VTTAPAPTPKSQLSLSPGNGTLRGLVSGATSAMPSSAAMRWAPALIMKVSSVQVRPARYQSSGTRRRSACGGRNTAKRMSQPVSSAAWRQKSTVPPNAP
jgi:hypothetical protein